MATTPGDVRELLMLFPRANGPGGSLWMLCGSISPFNVGRVENLVDWNYWLPRGSLSG